MSRATPVPHASQAPGRTPLNPYVFLVGAPRSGTRLLGRLVNAHPDTAALAVAREPTAWAPLAWGLALREVVEAAVRSGEPAVAEEALRELRERTQAAGTDWALGVEAASAALLARGADADGHYRAALEHLERGGCGSELGRAELLYGEWLRREGRRQEARARLRDAHERLAAMGAEGFAERALRELRATGEHARRRSPETADELTPQELHIARLVGTGATSKEVAAELFVSPRTVDAHLRNIFRKLDITSRRQLRGMTLDERRPPRRSRASVLGRCHQAATCSANLSR